MSGAPSQLAPGAADEGGEAPRKDRLRPFGVPKRLGVFLFALFWLILLIPRLRQLRRGKSWNRIRLGIGLFTILSVMAGVALNSIVLFWGGLALNVFALLAKPLPDPERERQIARDHEADYYLNGGTLLADLESLEGDIKHGAEVNLLLRGQELLFVPAASGSAIKHRLDIQAIDDIKVAGESYRPVFVSEAKDPPVREDVVDKTAATSMELIVSDGRTIRFLYTGAFSKHLAGTAAHTIYGVRQLGRPDGVGGESPKVFNIIGGENVAE